MKAAECYLKAAEQGYAKAQFNLGMMYRRGEGVEQSDVKAVEWYLKAAEQMDSFCIHVEGGGERYLM